MLLCGRMWLPFCKQYEIVSVLKLKRYLTETLCICLNFF